MIASGGYIVTNALMVSNARGMSRSCSRAPRPMPAASGSQLKGRGRTVEATIVGVAREVDLALLKVDAQWPTADGRSW